MQETMIILEKTVISKSLFRRLILVGTVLLAVGCSSQIATTKENSASTSIMQPGIAKGQSADVSNPEKGLNFRRLTVGIARQSDLDNYLNQILVKLQKGYTETPLPAHVFVAPESSYVAYSTADGAIFIPYGLLIDMESEDEVAALIAHEYSHTLKQHHITKDGADLWGNVYGVVNVLQRYNVLPQSELEILANEAALEVVQNALIPAMDREQEDVADKLGTDLLIAAGYNSLGMFNLLTRMVEWDRKNANQNTQKPVANTQVESVNNSIGIASLNLGLDSYIKDVGKSIKEQYDELKKEHYSAEDRKKTIRTYIKSVHSAAPRTELKTTELISIKNKPEVASFLQGLGMIKDINNQIQTPSVAKKTADALLKTQAKSVSYARFTVYNAYKSAGLEKEGLTYLKLDENSPDSLFSEQLDLIAYSEKVSAKEGLKTARNANKLLGEPNSLLPTLIRLEKKNGNTLQTAQLIHQCALLGDKALIAACDKAAN